MTGRPDLAALHRDTLERLVTEALQAVRAALTLNERLRGALDRAEVAEAHWLNDDVFVILNDLCQKVEQAIETEAEAGPGAAPDRGGA